uniref:Ig-like domain-containing protein n=1 Tax=Sphenodon punctatus TaxID=8508 RepID=A0A8D0GBD5_SPHPU
MEVRWFRSQLHSYVYLYRDGKGWHETQMPEYRERTELLSDGLRDGNVALRIQNARISDEGQYHCFVKNGTFHQKTILEVKVVASGSVPVISIDGYQGRGVRLVCRSSGWYPKPEVLWRDTKGQHLPSVTETKSQEENGLFETQNYIIMTEIAKQNLSCLVKNILLNLEKEAAVYITETLFPKISPWMAVLYATLLAWLGFLLLTIYLFKIK